MGERNHYVSDILIPPNVSRWIRLLFSREFPFDQMLILWDTLFSIDPTFKLIDLICTSMLLRIRWDCKAQMFIRGRDEMKTKGLNFTNMA